MISTTSNPVLGVFRSPYASYGARSDTMTLEGTALKTGALSLLTITAFAINWSLLENPETQGMGFALACAGSIGGLLLSFALYFWMSASPFLTPLYALGEGCLLSAVSYGVELRYPGIAFQAAALTILTVLAMAGLYYTRVIRVNDTFRTCVFGATLGIAMFYLLGGLLSLFGVHLPGLGFHADALSIIVSLVVVGVAALNLALDFDMIERGSGVMPKYMEWYGAFALLVTIIWLYIEILRLLTLIAQASQRR